jgi:4-amino-4-deoxy-L-arabinose transferase-like glycosyltransferase
MGKVSSIKGWVLRNKFEAVIFGVIILVALFLRFYNISGYMTFLGDEGRDALVIQGILVNHHIPLLGPPTSVGNMYLGPLYYYMMAVPMAVFWLNPVAAAGMDALIGVATVCLIYYLARVWFGKEAGVVASLLYAISPVTIIYSHSSWNPNPAPFFALLAFLGFHLAKVNGNYKWLILTGGALAFAAQMHYLALILLPIFGVLWLYELSLFRRHKTSGRNLLFGSLGGLITFLILMSPLLIFDLRHNFVNFHALLALLTTKNSGVSFNPLSPFSRILPIYNGTLINDYLAGSVPAVAVLTSLLVLIPIGLALWRRSRGKAFRFSILSLSVWLILGLVGLSFYQNQVYDHYLGFLNPAPYLLLGALIFYFKEKFRFWVALVILLILIPVNLMRSPLQYPANNQLSRTQSIAYFIIGQAGNQPFNFALLSEHNYDSAYQFYLGRFGHPPAKVPANITEQLFVVCEDANCQPINNPKYEIAGFGYSKIATVSNFDGVKVYKLVANPGGKPQ